MASTPKPPPIPDRYRRVTPALVVDGAAKALEFYAEVYGATERMRVPGPDGTIAHAEIEIGDSVVMVEDASPHRGTKAPPAGGLEGSPAALFIYVEDVDAVMDLATRLGATQERPAQDQFYGDRTYRCRDHEGHIWTFTQPVRSVNREEAELASGLKITGWV